METNEVRQLCEMLFGVLERGPWKDPEALGDAMSTVRTLRGAAPPHLCEKLAAIEEGFTRWFSTRRWHTDFEAQRLRHTLLQDITAVQNSWERPRDPP